MTESNEVRRYFDNAATSRPKPPEVLDAMIAYQRDSGASAGRGAYREAVAAGDVLDRCRAELREVFVCRPDDEVIFTLNGTDALNMAIKGAVHPGSHVVTTAMDHNSVLRPLTALQDAGGVTWSVVPADPETTFISPDTVFEAVRENTALIVINHASNVTGAVQELEPIAEFCRENEILLLVDAAQSAGHVPISFASAGFDMLAFPGHKGLLGPLGTGVLIMRAEVAEWLRSFREGGTGTQSERPYQPEFSPDKFESGSHNAIGIAGLLAAVAWIRAYGVQNLRQHEETLMARMIDRLSGMHGVRWFGPRTPERRVGVFSVRVGDIEPSALSAALEQSGVLTRSGLHCAPFAHETIGTHETGGTTRFSFGPFLTIEDVDAAAAAIADARRNVAQPA